MKLLLLLIIVFLAGCGSEPAPAPPSPPSAALVLTRAADYDQEGAAITACGNTIVESSLGPVAAAYKFRGYSSTVACYEQQGHYTFFAKL